MRADAQAVCLLTRRQVGRRRRGAAVRRGALRWSRSHMRVWDVRRRTLTALPGAEPWPTARLQPGRRLDRSGGGTWARTSATCAGQARQALGFRTCGSRGILALGRVLARRQPARDRALPTARALFSRRRLAARGPTARRRAHGTHHVPSVHAGRPVLATAAADGTVVLWDVETQKPIGAPLTLEPRRLRPPRSAPTARSCLRSRHAVTGVRLDPHRRPGSATLALSRARAHGPRVG